MNIVLINADSIFWEADKNIRSIDFRNIFSRIDEICTPDQIYFIGGLEETDPFNESLKDILRTNSKRPIIPVSSITKVSNRHNPELVLIDLLYRGVLTQSFPQSNKFVIASADASSVRPANFLASKKLIQPVDYIFPDCMANLGEIAQKVVVRSLFPLRPNARGVVEKTIVRAVGEIIKKDSSREVPFLNTTALLISKCKNDYGLNPTIVRPFVLSLIHNNYLTRQKFEAKNKSGETVLKTGIVFGEKDLNELLG